MLAMSPVATCGVGSPTKLGFFGTLFLTDERSVVEYNHEQGR